MDMQMLRERVNQATEMMSPQLRRASAVLLERPDDVALLSMRELASRAALPPSTFVRLSQMLGFAGYSEMRQIFADRLRGRPRVYSERAELLQEREDDGAESALLKEIFGAELRNIERTLARNDTAAILRIIEFIEDADRIFLLGQRSCYPVAYFFDYVYRLFAQNAVLVEDTGGAFGDRLRGIARGDLLIAASVRPYTRSTIRGAEFAAARGADIVSITDDELSPLVKRSREVLFVEAGSPSFFHSIVSPLVLVEVLLAVLMARGGTAALARLEASEEQLNLFDAYWTDGKVRRRQ
jgi:DNA-binding MurR/RpiR family transcriptional regulator